MDKLQAKSALYTDYRHGLNGISSGNPISLKERQGLTMLNLVVWGSSEINQVLQKTINLSLPSPGQSTGNDQHSVLWTGPDRYLIVSVLPTILESISIQITDEHGALQDLTSARTVIRMQGPNCRLVMAKGLNLPLDQASFTDGQVVLSSFDHHYPAIIHNISDEPDGFDVYVTRSFALSFWQWLCDSSLEYGYEVLEPQSNG